MIHPSEPNCTPAACRGGRGARRGARVGDGRRLAPMAAAITAAPAARTVGPPRHSPTGRSFRTRRRANHLHRSCIACARMGCLSLRIGSCRRMDSCVSGPAQCCMSSASRWRQQMGLSSAEVLYRLSTTQLELYVTTRTWYVQACSVLCTDHLGSS